MQETQLLPQPPPLEGLHPPPWGCNTSEALRAEAEVYPRHAAFFPFFSGPSVLQSVPLLSCCVSAEQPLEPLYLLSARCALFALTPTSHAYNSLLHFLHLARSLLKFKVYFNAKLPTAQSLLTLRLGQSSCHPSCQSFQPRCFSVEGCFFTS